MSARKYREDEGPGIGLPQFKELREAVAGRVRLPRPARIRQEAVAGLTVAISSVPDGMAGGLLAGVNPIYGLYASMIGPIVGGLFASTVLMVITNTSAASLVAGQALVGLSIQDRDRALFLLVILSGVFQILFGVLRLGRLTRFVSHSVMTGFLAGIAVILILSQLPTVVGFEAEGSNRVTQTAYLLLHLGGAHVRSLWVAGLTAVVGVVLLRTRIRPFASLAAIVVPTLVVAVLGWDDVRLVADVGRIPFGLPLPFVPAPSDFSMPVLTGALSLALVVLVQGAGVGQSVPNPDGSRRSDSRNFVAQGAANIAAGFLRGVPVGGSLGATALNVVSGASRRCAAIFAGFWMLVFLIALAGAVSRVAMPALGALLILAGIRSIKPQQAAAVWRAGWPARIPAITTFFATLILPIQGAVGLGVLLAALLHVVTASTDVVVKELVERPDGQLEERDPPMRLPGGKVTVLDIYGTVFFAGARTLERLLPRPGPERRPAVVLSLRGYPAIGATMVEVLSHYAEELRRVDGRLYLCGISGETMGRLVATGEFREFGPVRVYAATHTVWESMRRARADAEAWLAGEEDADDRGDR